MISWMGDMNIVNLAVETIYAADGEALSIQERENNVLHYMVEGTRDYLRNNEKCFSVQANHLLLLPTGSRYLTISTSRSMGLSIDFSLQNSTHEEVILDTFPTVLAMDHSGYYAARMRQAYAYVLEGGCALLKAKALLYDMLYTFCVQHSRLSTQRQMLLPAVQHMETHLAEPCKPETLAQLCYMSKSTFYRRFQSEFHTTPAQWHMNLRLERAREWLLTGECTVEEVAGRLGFCDAAHFSRLFYRFAGVHAGSCRRL